MYDGTLGTKGPWQALVTFQQFIILADSDGVVDMTAEAISRRTTLPQEIINIGIAALEQPDQESRSPDENGCRIVRLNDNRNWGWRVVNYPYYRAIRTAEERREYHKLYARKRVRVNKSQQNQPIEEVNAYAEAEGINKKAWDEFVEHRKDIKMPLSELAAKKNRATLSKYSPEQQQEIVDTTISNGWRGLFPPKHSGKTNSGKYTGGAIGRAMQAFDDFAKKERDKEASVIPEQPTLPSH